MRNLMRLTEKQLGGWSLLLGTAAVAVGYALSPGRGVIDTVPSTELNELTQAMARNEVLSYTVPIVIICGALLMLNGFLTLRRYAGAVPRLGLMAMAVALVLQMVMRGLDYMITGMGVAALETSDTVKSQEWLQSALQMQRMVWGMHFTSGVAGYIGLAVMALGLAFRPEPVRLPPLLHAIVASAVRRLAGRLHYRMALQPVGAGLRPRLCRNVRSRTRLHGPTRLGPDIIQRHLSQHSHPRVP